jgi:hypothetical protein
MSSKKAPSGPSPLAKPETDRLFKLSEQVPKHQGCSLCDPKVDKIGTFPWTFHVGLLI